MSLGFANPGELLDAVGRETGPGEWFEIDQARIEAFADATSDHQWIHLDAERAAAGPFGTTVAHGYLTLSLLPALSAGLLQVDGLGMAVNYGLDKVRFIQAVPSGSRVRVSAVITDAVETPIGIRLHQRVTVEIEGHDKPALVAETIALLAPAPAP